jgi:hypothetical protein
MMELKPYQIRNKGEIMTNQENYKVFSWVICECEQWVDSYF